MCVAGTEDRSHRRDGLRAYRSRQAICARILQNAIPPTELRHYAGPAESLDEEIAQRFMERTWVLRSTGQNYPALSRLHTLHYFLPHLKYVFAQGWRFEVMIPDNSLEDAPSMAPLADQKLILINPQHFDTDFTLDMVDAVVSALVIERMQQTGQLALLKELLDDEVERSLQAHTQTSCGTGGLHEALDDGTERPFENYDQLLTGLVALLAGKMALIRAYENLRERDPGIRHEFLEAVHQALAEGTSMKELALNLLEEDEHRVKDWAFKALTKEVLESGLLENWGLGEVVLGIKANAGLKSVPGIPVAEGKIFFAQALDFLPRTQASTTGRYSFLTASASHLVYTERDELRVKLQTIVDPGTITPLTFEEDSIVLAAAGGHGGNGKHFIGRQSLTSPDTVWAYFYEPSAASQQATVRGDTVLLLSRQLTGHLPGITPIHLFHLDSKTGKVRQNNPLGAWSARAQRIYAGQKTETLVWTLGTAERHDGIVLTDLTGGFKSQLKFQTPGETRVREASNGNFWVEHLTAKGTARFINEVKVLSPDGLPLMERRLINSSIVAADATHIYFLNRAPDTYGWIDYYSVTTMLDKTRARSLQTLLDFPYEQVSDVGVVSGDWLYLSTPQRIYAMSIGSDAVRLIYERPFAHVVDSAITPEFISLGDVVGNVLNTAYRYYDTGVAVEHHPRRVRLLSLELP